MQTSAATSGTASARPSSTAMDPLGGTKAMDAEELRVCYESVVKHNPTNSEAVHFLAMWHFERHSFQQARKYFGHLATLRESDPEVWICLSICCAMVEAFKEAKAALKLASGLVDSPTTDIKIGFCRALVAEKKREFPAAMDGYLKCLQLCTPSKTSTPIAPITTSHRSSLSQQQQQASSHAFPSSFASSASATAAAMPSASPTGQLPNRYVGLQNNIKYINDIKGEIMLRIAILKKELRAYDQSSSIVMSLIEDHSYSPSIHADAYCLQGILYEIENNHKQAEVPYRKALEILPSHMIALERLGRVYLRYRETIPAAVTYFFKAVETNPSSAISWYLLGRCYMATTQYTDAFEAYNRAVNLNPNDPCVWCSLGVLYYIYGQYKESLGMLARGLKLDSSMGDAWYNVGALYDMCDQPVDAQMAYVRARENGVDEVFTRVGLTVNPISSMATAPATTSAADASAAATGTAGGTAGGTGMSSRPSVASVGSMDEPFLSQSSAHMRSTPTSSSRSLSSHGDVPNQRSVYAYSSHQQQQPQHQPQHQYQQQHQQSSVFQSQPITAVNSSQYQTMPMTQPQQSQQQAYVIPGAFSHQPVNQSQFYSSPSSVHMIKPSVHQQQSQLLQSQQQYYPQYHHHQQQQQQHHPYQQQQHHAHSQQLTAPVVQSQQVQSQQVQSQLYAYEPPTATQSSQRFSPVPQVSSMPPPSHPSQHQHQQHQQQFSSDPTSISYNQPGFVPSVAISSQGHSGPQESNSALARAEFDDLVESAMLDDNSIHDAHTTTASFLGDDDVESDNLTESEDEHEGTSTS